MSRRLTDQIIEWVEASLDTHLLGDNALFDVAMLLDQQQGPLVSVMLWMPSLVLGESLQVVGVMPNGPSISAVQVDQFIHDGLEAMRQQRSKQAGERPTLDSLLVAGR